MKTLCAFMDGEGNPQEKTTGGATRSSYATLKCLLTLLLALSVAGTLLAVSGVNAQQQGVFTVVAKVYPKAGKEAEVQALLLKMAEAVRKAEPENIIYRPHRSTKEPSVFLWYEQFRSEAAFEFHRTAPHLAEYRKQLGAFLEKPTEVELYRSLAE